MTVFSLSTASSNQYLVPPPAPSRKTSERLHRACDDLDEFLSSDLELSFASTMSLNSPTRDSATARPSTDSPVPMDISPAPQLVKSKESVMKSTRPRAFTSAARVFGRDIGNDVSSCLNSSSAPISGTASHSGQKRTQRSALPAQWLAQAKSSPAPEMPQCAVVPCSFHLPAASPFGGDAMEVDTFVPASAPPDTISFLPPAPSAAAAIDALFFDTMSPGSGLESPGYPLPKKRRSCSPAPSCHENGPVSSSPVPPSSPSQRKLERFASTGHAMGPLFPSKSNKPTLESLGTPSNVHKRRRPALSTLVGHPSERQTQSTYPVSTAAPQDAQALPPVRRAFSAMIPGTILANISGEASSDDHSFDGPDMSSPAQAYAKRQNVKTIRRCDGTDDFRPWTGATAMVERESPVGAGMPGFGDNEAHGKILPCHRVREDGLMRIDCKTLGELLDGQYDSRIANYHVIDCRFDYEYEGGHIQGAVNINTTAGIEEFLLGNKTAKPNPGVSGDSVKKTVIVFHCEFSAKRAPTFAKHLRSRDRALNNHLYPKIHYPEVYILQGGYCQYFKESAARCVPVAYVTMDDPTHAASRREDLGQFRKAHFGRTKSYAYGDGLGKPSISAQLNKRNTAPAGNPLFAAANAARIRRGGGEGALATLDEDGNTTAQSDDDDGVVGDSPCPPPSKGAAFNLKKIGRGPFVRAETYGPSRR